MQRTKVLVLIALSLFVLHGCETADQWDDREEQKHNCDKAKGKPERTDPFSNQTVCRIPAP